VLKVIEDVWSIDQEPPCFLYAIVTLKTGYLRIQALSQDKKQGVHPRAAT
jgi:hypothetical protein